MGSFKDNLEDLDERPRYIDPGTWAKNRRDSNANRLNKNNNIIFLTKRERLESDDFLHIPQQTPKKKGADAGFQFMNSCEKFEQWNTALLNRDLDMPPMDIIGPKDSELQPLLTEAESVIDQKLTIDARPGGLLNYGPTKPQPEVREEVTEEDQKFVFKVHKTDSQILISNQTLDSRQLDVDGCSDVLDIAGEGQEPKPNNLIFADEPAKLLAKVPRVTQYWNRTSLLIPNVFRLLKTFSEDDENLLEFQEYSHKELLVQSNGTKFHPQKHKTDHFQKTVTARQKRSRGRTPGVPTS